MCNGDVLTVKSAELLICRYYDKKAIHLISHLIFLRLGAPNASLLPPLAIGYFMHNDTALQLILTNSDPCSRVRLYAFQAMTHTTYK